MLHSDLDKALSAFKEDNIFATLHVCTLSHTCEDTEFSGRAFASFSC